ncbi:GTP cyclohydrolase FolE2 [archaeon BMS3Abin16]|nr:GTP cyclohydrolase FolE2 [archaeon BMS3Abin16]HDY74241.1 GTP cyclohydrolase I FolE2 [Euryarchaeota archaeon]
MTMKDTQESEPPVYIKLNRVGVTGIKKTIIRKKDGQYNVLLADIKVFIDLPSHKKGIHMSRNLEVTNEIIERAIGPEVEDIELLCIAIAKTCLMKQEATRAEVEMRADYSLPRVTPVTKMPTQEKYELIAKAVAWRDGDNIKVRRSVGAVAEGLTVCPCSIESVQHYVTENFNIDKDIVAKLPLSSHNQRGMGTLIVETDEDERVEANDIVGIIEDAMSSPLYEVLKRSDELKVVVDAHRKPRFVEDVLRMMVKGLVEKYPDLSDTAYVRAQQENFESIHRHNTYAEKSGFFGEIKEELNGNGNNS